MLRRGLVLLVCLLLHVAVVAWPAVAAAAPAWSVAPVPAWVTPVEAAADGSPPSAPDAPNGGRYLLIDRQTRVGYVVESYTRWSRQITNEAGLAGSSQVNVDFDPTYETLAIHSVTVRRGSDTRSRLVPDAVKIVQRERNLEAQLFDGRQSAVLFVDDLRVGDIVECAFTITAADPTAQGHFTDSIVLGTTEPVSRLHVRLLMTGGKRVRLLVHAPDGDRSPYGAAPTTTSAGTEYEWDLRDVRAYPVDPLAPSWHASYPWVQVSDFESWTDVAAWGARLFQVGGQVAQLGAPPQGKLSEWVKNTRSKSPSQDAFLLRAIRFVQDEIRYVGIETGMSRRRPTEPATVFERRYGDCKDKAALLVTLLQLAGIGAQPVLVSTSHGHVLDELIPSGAIFNHAIVRVEGPGERVYWVDATIALQGGGLERLQYSQHEHALVLRDHGDRLVALTRAPDDQPSASIRDRYGVTMPTSTDETTLDSVRRYEGSNADAMRSQLQGKTAEEIGKYFVSVYQGAFPAIREARALEQEDDRDGNVFRLEIHLSIPRFWTFDATQGRYVATLTSGAMLGALSRPPTAKRSAPLAFPHPLRMEAVMDLQLPFDLALTPEDTVASDRAFELRFVSAYASRRLTYSYSLHARAPELAQAEVHAHLEQIDKAHAMLSRSLTYRPPVPDGFNWAGFVALLGSVPFVCWGSYRAYRYEPRSSRRLPAVPVEARFETIGGWLVLLALNVALSPIRNVEALVRTARVALSLATWRAVTTPELATYSPGLAVATIVETIGLAACVAYGSAVAVLFFRRRRSFPFHFTIYAIGMMSFSVLDHFVVSALAEISKTTGAGTGLAAVRLVVWTAIWVTYVRTSSRAAGTFVTRAPRRRRSPRRKRDPA